jgi:hypothetical protein
MPSYIEKVKALFHPFEHCVDVIPCSAITGLGKAEILGQVAHHIAR